MPTQAMRPPSGARRPRSVLSLLVLPFVVALAAIATACGTTEGERSVSGATAVARAPARIMPLGDSITWGEEMPGGQPRNSGGYRSGLWEGLRWNGFTSFQFVGSSWNAWAPGDRAGMDTAQEGHPGWTSRDLRDNVGWILASARPEYVLLMIGTNDLFQGMSTDDSTRAMGDAYDAILASPGLRRLMVASVIPCASGGSYGNLRNDDVARLDAAISGLVAARAAQGASITFVDMFAWAGIGDADLSDGAHPSDSGYAKMSLVWTIAMRDQLARDGR